MPIVWWLAGALLGGFGGFLFGQSRGISEGQAMGPSGTWQALKNPFTIPPLASVVVVDTASSQNTVDMNGLPATPLGASLVASASVSAQAGGISGYQAFAPNSTLPNDWPPADTYPKNLYRYEFTNGPVTQNVSPTPLAVFQWVPATSST